MQSLSQSQDQPQDQPQKLTFDEFLVQYPEDGGRYELHYGAVVEMRPIGPHEQVGGFISDQLTLEIYRLGLPYFIPRSCLVRPVEEFEAYLPDIIVLNRETIGADPYWKKASTISTGASAKLAIEVVSTNWRADYSKKLAEYELLGIPEYWVVDYRGLGAKRLIGSPKEPTVSVYVLSDDEYSVTLFKGQDAIASPAFPELNITVAQLVQMGESVT
ncbi:Uma2 family endonuclease [Myxacorys almedinensis A]|uniref:Uma2 family endonuclease n=2 Tax=Myxacorys TaxID=2056239 RepID=A0A8J8CLJ4_9CYAN|nr:Uma2 family endonuclease [Myxacorys almedinensis A]